MTPEEQNAVQARQQIDSIVQRKLWAWKQWKEKTDNQYANQQEVARDNDTMNLYQNSLQATDKEIKAQYNVASRANLLAWMISDRAKEQGIELTWNASDIVWDYLQWFPDDYQAFMDFTHGDQDPEDFAVQMGWMEKPENDAGFFTNMVWWAYDSVTWLPRMIGKWTANAIGWVAKQFWADDAKVDELVNGYKNYLDSDWSSEAIGSDKDSWTYKGTKLVWDLAQVATAEWLAKNAIKATPLWKVAMDAIKQAPLGYRAAAWAIEWAWDMALYDMVSESELPSAWDLALWAWLWAIAPIAWAGYKAVKAATKKNAVNLAEKILQNANRMTKGEQSKFYQRYNQSVWQWLNDRWLRNWEDIVNYFTNSKNKVDEAMASIKWEFTDDSLTEVLDDVVDFAIGTKSPQADRMIALAEKNRKWWLTMSEINEVKRYFEAHNKFNYLSKWTAEQAERATNMDTALRDWQRKVAEENWFTNLGELNRETAAAKEILNWSTKREAWVKGNNPISITDWIAVMWWGLSPESVATLALKKWWDSPTVKSKIVDMLNRIWWHETMTEKLADLEKIMAINKIKDQKALEKYVDDLYKELWVWDTTPRLPETTQWWVAAWEKWFVTQNPTAPTYQEMWLWNIKEINSLDKGGEGMYNTSNNLSTNQFVNDTRANWISKEQVLWAGNQGYAGTSSKEMSNLWTNPWGVWTSQWPIRQVQSSQEMRDLTEKIKSTNPRAAFVDTHPIEEYDTYMNFANQDKAVWALTPDQDIVNFASVWGWAWKPVMFEMISKWWIKMDNYWEWLVREYEKYWFEPVAKTKWDDKFAPANWNYAEHWRPDIYFMKHNWDPIEVVKEKFWTYPHKSLKELDELPVKDYMDAYSYRDEMITADPRLKDKIWKK